ncbi:MAG: hypothetical protein QXM31_00925 [Candidatus Woesearchaeota archaeon]
MSKKGAWTGFVLHPAFETFVAVCVLISLMWFIHGLDEQTSFEKRFLATDLALLIDTIPAMPQPGSAHIIYTPPLIPKFRTNYTFRFNKTSVSVLSGPQDRSPGMFYITPDPSVSIQEAELSFRDVLVVPDFYKEGSTIYVYDRNKKPDTYVRNVLACGTAGIAGKPVAQPAHASGPEMQAEQNIASVLKGQIFEGSEVLVVLRIGSTAPDATYIKAYVNGENPPELLRQSQRIACEVSNSLLRHWEGQNIGVIGAAVIPINPEHTASRDDDALSKGKVGILLEFGTLQLLDSVDKQEAVALRIAQGVKNARP